MNKRNILIALVVALIIMQFFPIDKTNAPVDQAKDFLTMENAPTEVAQLFKTACYDCHSDETKYPWYTSVAPISWFIKGHIDEGHEHINFSTWADYDAKKKAHKMEEIIEVVDGKEMPMLTYWMIHWDAKISEEQRKQMTDWVRTKQ
jgi:mono/diheme cytochrome c family protein